MLTLLALFVLQAPKPKANPLIPFNPPVGAPPFDPQGGIKSDDLKVEKRDDNGNVIGTEFFHLEYDVSTRIVDLPSGDDIEAVDIYCENECLGNTHKSHAECDLSCDKVCTKDHHFTLRGYYEDLTQNMRQMEADSAKLNAKGSAGTDPPDWESAVSHALRDAERDASQSKVDETPAHIKDPCSSDLRTYGYNVKQFQVHGEMHKVGFYMTKGVKTPIDELVGTQDGVVALLYYPNADPLDEIKGVICACEKKIFPPKDNPKRFIDEFGPWTPLVEDPGGDLLFPGPGIGVDANGEDLDDATVNIENHTGKDVRVILQPGDILESDDPDSQTMVILEMLSVLCPAESRVPLCLGGSGLATTLKPRVECTEMTKHQPTEKTKFHLKRAQNDHLTQLCKLYGKTNFHFGNDDQARAWILLSHARIDEINKHLIPGVSPGTYLTALSDVAATGVDVSTGEYKPCADPSLFEGDTSSRKAVAWYARYWERRDAGAFASYLPKLVDHEKEALTSTEAAEVRHAADLAIALLSSTDPKVRMAGLQILSDAVPAEKRADVARDGGLQEICCSLGSGDEAEVLAALAVVDAYQDKSELNQVAGLSTYSKNANVKSAAQALKEKLKG